MCWTVRFICLQILIYIRNQLQRKQVSILISGLVSVPAGPTSLALRLIPNLILNPTSYSVLGGLIFRLIRATGRTLFEGRYPKQNSRPPVLCYHSPLSLSLLVYSPLFLRHQRKAYCYYCCYSNLPPVDIIFSCPETITLITVAKTLIIANPGCFPWTSQANIYSPNRKCPSDSLPPESSWVRDSPPPFSSLQPR